MRSHSQAVLRVYSICVCLGICMTLYLLRNTSVLFRVALTSLIQPIVGSFLLLTRFDCLVSLLPILPLLYPLGGVKGWWWEKQSWSPKRRRVMSLTCFAYITTLYLLRNTSVLFRVALTSLIQPIVGSFLLLTRFDCLVSLLPILPIFRR